MWFFNLMGRLCKAKGRICQAAERITTLTKYLMGYDNDVRAQFVL